MQFAERCQLKLNKVDNPFPSLRCRRAHHRQLLRAGLPRRLQKRLEAEMETWRTRPAAQDEADYRERLEREIECIRQMKFSGLLPHRVGFHQYARARHSRRPGTRLGCGVAGRPRMEITTSIRCETCALRALSQSGERIASGYRYRLLMNRRGEVIECVMRKYGREQVAQIITFNTMAAKAAIKDVGRALDMPERGRRANRQARPATIGTTIEQHCRKDSAPTCQPLKRRPNGARVWVSARASSKG